MQHAYFERDPLRLIASCPVCRHRYDPLQAHMLGMEGETRVWYMMCSMCRHAVLVSVLVSEEGVNSVGILTDLSLREVIFFRDQNAIDFDDIISLHEAVQDSFE